ncbi:phosphoribosylamine--glycine ligase [Comamonadaceae bacterium G21597-S1]|nr:phosphoribosylamine--glycine ligase [Comamonadaceae bacterium G21597-S1]
MKVLVIGGGGREHALAWKLAQSSRIETVFVAPGNGGTAQAERIRNIEINDLAQLCDWAVNEKIGLTVVGPEVPLAAGVVDLFRERGLRIFGPTKAAAQLESSKAFSKDFMQRHKIPTALHMTFSDRAQAHAFVTDRGAPIVVKADGLAAGKGVVVAREIEQAHAAIDRMLPEVADPHTRVVIEQCLEGEEASFIVMCDGKNVLALATSQDHKRLLDGDQGPNTGGMGAYSPAAVVTPAVHAKAMREIILPTIRGMEKDGIAYTGFLYAGLMIDAYGQPRTLEFNCRLGDPETQPILMRLKTDLLELLLAATETGDDRKLDQIELQWDRRTALGVVLAAKDYPQQPRTDDRVRGLPQPGADVMVFHAGTRREGDDVFTSGGRVLCVTALADNVRQAQQRAYEVVREIQFDGMQYRGDIGHRAA